MNKNDEIVIFEKKYVKEYLDDMIEYWRNKRDEAHNVSDDQDKLIASCYVDAYQSVRKNLFGELKE